MAATVTDGMSAPPNKLSEETVREVKRRLEEGESPEDIHEDDDMPSRRKVYDIKKEWEQQKEQQEEMEQEVFRDKQQADRDDIIDVLEQAGVGIKQSGDPKADVEKALNAIDFDSAWDDPHYVADTLVEEAGMKREWANRVVRKAYDMPDFPYVEQQEPGGGERDRRRRSRRRGRGGREQHREPRGRDRSRGRGRGGRDESPDRENSQLRREMQQLQNTVSELAEAVTEAVQDDGDDSDNMVTIEQGDKTMQVPYHVAVSQGLLGDSGSDEKGFMDKLREAKEAGIIPDPEDFQQDDDNDMFEMLEKAEQLGLIGDDDSNEEIEVMREMMDEMSEQFAEAQQNVATQMSAAISQLAEEQEDDEDEVTMSDLQEWWEEKQKEDELDRLENELSEMREELRSEMRGSSRSPRDPEQDPEVVKKRIDTEHERDQLEMVNDTLQSLPDQMAKAVREGVLPLYKELEHAVPGDGNPLWSPPEGGERGQPGFTPQADQQTKQGGGQSRDTQRQPSRAEQSGYPEQDSADQQQGGEEEARMGEEQPSANTEERAQSVREKLGLDDGTEGNQAGA